jgi:hypothetical protein
MDEEGGEAKNNERGTSKKVAMHTHRQRKTIERECLP